MKAASLYLRCLGWGVATGAAVGGGVGTVIGLLAGVSGRDPGLVGIDALAGLVFGILIALVPALLGGIAVVVVLGWRQPRPASFEAVRRDLTVIFAAVVGLLNLVVLTWWAALGGGNTVPVVTAVLVFLDAGMALMLKPARTSIARAWVDGADLVGAERLAPGSWYR